jgi:hypothetical protein
VFCRAGENPKTGIGLGDSFRQIETGNGTNIQERKAVSGDGLGYILGAQTEVYAIYNRPRLRGQEIRVLRQLLYRNTRHMRCLSLHKRFYFHARQYPNLYYEKSQGIVPGAGYRHHRLAPIFARSKPN